MISKAKVRMSASGHVRFCYDTSRCFVESMRRCLISIQLDEGGWKVGWTCRNLVLTCTHWWNVTAVVKKSVYEYKLSYPIAFLFIIHSHVQSTCVFINCFLIGLHLMTNSCWNQCNIVNKQRFQKSCNWALAVVSQSHDNQLWFSLKRCMPRLRTDNNLNCLIC